MQSALAEGLHSVSPEGAALAGGAFQGVAPRPSVRARLLRLMKITVGVAVAAALGWSPLRALFGATSVEALLNARVETIRSPIDGVLDGTPVMEWKADAAPGALHVRDRLADPARLDDLRRQYAALEAQSNTLQRQSELERSTLDRLTVQIELFREGRMKLLAARMKAREAEFEGAAAKSAEADNAKHRLDRLRPSGVVSVADAERIEFEWIAASAAKAAAEQRLEEAKAESEAVEHGLFIGDSYNEGTSVAEHAAELRLRLSEVEAQAAAARAQMNVLAAQIAEEEERYRRRSDAVLPLPPSGRVWETLAGPGEHVSRGQDILRVLDCSQRIVSATVDESVYDSLALGGPAEFRPRQGGGKSYAGTIVNLTGAAAASGNLAIPFVAMRKGPFYVTVALDGASEEGCSIGQTGTVTFDTNRPGPQTDATRGEPQPADAPPLRAVLN